MIDLSIVLPTVNRASLLAQAISTLERNTHCSFEIIVVNGASTDHTRDVLADAGRRLGDRLRVIHEEKREGFVRGTNKGFRAASGKYLTWLNDDARPSQGALDLAVQQLESYGESVGFVALFHRWHSMFNIAYESFHNGKAYRLCHIRGTLYANFPVGLRSTYEKLGFFDERYYVCAADPDLSLKAWHAGLSIVPACGSFIDHDELDDDRRVADSKKGVSDNDRLFEKWDLPPKDTTRNAFDPRRPCTLRGLRAVGSSAA